MRGDMLHHMLPHYVDRLRTASPWCGMRCDVVMVSAALQHDVRMPRQRLALECDLPRHGSTAAVVLEAMISIAWSVAKIMPERLRQAAVQHGEFRPEASLGPREPGPPNFRTASSAEGRGASNAPVHKRCIATWKKRLALVRSLPSGRAGAPAQRRSCHVGGVGHSSVSLAGDLDGSECSRTVRCPYAVWLSLPMFSSHMQLGGGTWVPRHVTELPFCVGRSSVQSPSIHDDSSSLAQQRMQILWTAQTSEL